MSTNSAPTSSAKVGQLFSAALAGDSSVDDALAQAQAVATREMTKAGYIK
jgi:sorbitol/mannitol transport system substrate-binding protein